MCTLNKYTAIVSLYIMKYSVAWIGNPHFVVDDAKA
jgi:hypothetical protein